MKAIDKKFFEFIGINVDESLRIIGQIEANCGIKSILEYSEEELRYKYIEYLERTYLKKNSELSILKDIIRRIKDVAIYDKDITTALYMLVGSRYSGWELEIEPYEKLPFSIIYNNNRKYQSLWCNAFRTIFGNEQRRDLFSEIMNRTRVTKYSYLKMKNVEREIEKVISDKKIQYRRMGENIDGLTLKEREGLKFNYYMSQDGIENLILFDWVFGVSFAEICYVHMSKIQIKDTNYLERLIGCLEEIKGYHIRNELADIILQQYSIFEMSHDIFEKFMSDLEDIVKVVNTIYVVSLQQVWSRFTKKVEDDELEIWKEIILENALGVFVSLNTLYSKKVSKEICNEKGVMNINKAESADEKIEEIIEYLNFMNSIPNGLSLNEIKKIDKKRKKDDEIRADDKFINSKNELYIKIQSVIMKRQNMGNFPTFFQ